MKTKTNDKPKTAAQVQDDLVKHALWQTWNAIASDLESSMSEAGERLTNAGAYECILDADRVKMYGGNDAATVAAVAEFYKLDWNAMIRKTRKLLGRLV